MTTTLKTLLPANRRLKEITPETGNGPLVLGKVRFAGYDCRVELMYYASNGRAGLRLVADFDHCAEEDVSAGDLVTTASVNLVNDPMDRGEIAVKSWGENIGMEKLLVESGILLPAHRTLRAGFSTATIHRFAPLAQAGGAL